jgi:hypothetical protein
VLNPNGLFQKAFCFQLDFVIFSINYFFLFSAAATPTCNAFQYITYFSISIHFELFCFQKTHSIDYTFATITCLEIAGCYFYEY